MSKWKTDWHLHTTYSDGILTVEELLREAQDANLTHLAITDHDSLGNWNKIDEFNKAPSIFTIPSVEFGVEVPSSSWGDEEVHILGYGLNPKNEELHQYLKKLQGTRKSRFIDLLERAEGVGYSFSKESIELIRQEDSPGRLHLARLLVLEGYFTSIYQVFEDFLGVGKPGYIKRFRYDLMDMSRLIHQCGGIAILAHPFQIKSELLRKHLIGSEWIDGFEAFHPSHGAVEAHYLLAEAKRRKKYATGGSDFHGPGKRLLEKVGDFVPPSDKIISFIEWTMECPYGKYIGIDGSGVK